MLVITIEDLEVCMSDLNLPLKKNVLWFESLAQKKEIDKQMVSALYYKY